MTHKHQKILRELTFDIVLDFKTILKFCNYKCSGSLNKKLLCIKKKKHNKRNQNKMRYRFNTETCQDFARNEH